MRPSCSAEKYSTLRPRLSRTAECLLTGRRFWQPRLITAIAQTEGGSPLAPTGRQSLTGERIREAQQVTGRTQTADAQTLKATLKADREIDFEEGDLLVPLTFEDTQLERTTN